MLSQVLFFLNLLNYHGNYGYYNNYDYHGNLGYYDNYDKRDK